MTLASSGLSVGGVMALIEFVGFLAARLEGFVERAAEGPGDAPVAGESSRRDIAEPQLDRFAFAGRHGELVMSRGFGAGLCRIDGRLLADARRSC